MKIIGVLGSLAVLLTLSGPLPGQAGTGDTLLLDEVLIRDELVNAGKIFREDRFDTDSLIPGRATLAEALRGNTTIFVRSYGNNGVATLSLRGTSSNHTLVYWNNLEIGSPMLGVTDLSTIPVQAVDNMRIQYGFASLNDGTGGIGGSIRLNNSWSALHKSTMEMNLYGGSFGRWQGSASVNLTKKKWGLSLGALHFTARNDFTYPDITEPGNPQERMLHAQFDQNAFWALLYYRPSDFEQLSLKTMWTQTSRDIPPTLIGDQDIYDHLQDERLLSVLEYQRFKTRSHLMLSSGLVLDRNHFVSGGDSSSFNNLFTSWQNSLRYSIKVGEKLSVESGGRFRAENAGSAAYGNNVNQFRSSIFTDWRYQASPKIEVSLLLREELIDRIFSPLLGAVGLAIQLDSSQGLRLHLARNYRYPSLNDRYWNPGGNPDLLPESSYNLEAGYNLHISGWPVLKAGIFHNIIDNWIMWRPEGSYWSPQNIRKVANTGIELGLSDKFALGKFTWSWQLDYTHTRSRLLANYDGAVVKPDHQLPYVPEHLFGGGLEIEYKKVYLRYRQQVSDSYYVNSDNTVYMPAYTIANVNIGWRNILNSGKHLITGNLELNNLFNYPYQILPYRPEPGFNIGLSIKYQLQR